ncbi:hypothetical protein PSV09DRAFT_2394266 [Bipolaris maydis]|nr:hypothetical protein J3E74DRAFT_469719 [Bipolaris maydis]KAJ5052475.1 hypothetical protein J3E74DRAFT_469562 [Bipolaris maydis]KAJ6203618.1 hypothetical protein PSV09DRAFT_2394266 [Bipolaris maydis]
MSTQSRSQIVQSNPLGKTQDLLVRLLSALRGLTAARILQFQNGGKNLFYGLLRLNARVSSDSFDNGRIRPLLDAIINNQPNEIVWDRVYEAITESTPPPRPFLSFQQTPLWINAGSFANSAEHRKHVDDVLKEELGNMYVGVPDFFDAFGDVRELGTAAQVVLDKCKEGDSPLYCVESGWQGWPERAKEKDVLSWFALLVDQLLDIADKHLSTSRSSRPLAQPHRPLQGSSADRKLDVGFVDDPNAGGGARRFVLGFTLCGPFMRLWDFDRLGGIASEQFDINEDGLQFLSAVFGFLWMNEAQLGFDPTIITIGDQRYIEIERENGKERLVIDEVIKRKVHQEEAPGTPLVGVKNVARYFHHETVHVHGRDDVICANVRNGLDITKAMNYMPKRQMPPPNNTGRWRNGGSNVAGRKRSSSSTNAPLPPSKRPCSSSPTKPVILNRIHRRVIVRDYGKAIYKASSPASLLAAFEQCIDGYESLRTRGGISPNSLMVNEDAENPSWPAFLVDLDLAIDEQREMSSGARGKTGTRAFIAIRSFSWVLFWVCVHCDGPGKDIGPTEFESQKGLISDERDFLKTVKAKFTTCYKPLAPYVNRLRRKVFPDGGRWRDSNSKLYLEMKEILRAARDDLKELEG